ncbi:Vgb family protein [Microvirga yunnanensis]|uniref:Vgb family protein n=1 Tax=Microvirga yunnanensis TaxID=2953740 RepID=UPI0021C9D776|nr:MULTISPECIES: hypothetical protein [unclassified Microvirga]
MTAEVKRTGDFVAWGFDALWMMTAVTTVLVNGERQVVGPALVRVDGKTDQAEDNLIEEATASVRGLAVGEGAVWIPNSGREQIFKFDPVEKKVVLTIPVHFSGTEGSIGVGEGSVWITARGNVLTRFNAMTGTEEAAIKLPGLAPAAIVDNGFVWVTGFERGELYKFDARANALVRTIPLRPGPRFLTAGEGSIWVHNQGDNSVQRIDPASGQVIATIETGLSGRGGDIATGGGYVWLTLKDTPLIQIDPKTNTVAAIFQGTGWGDAIRFGGGSLWISGHSIRRLTPPD